MIDNQEAVRVIDANRGDGVIIATMNANNVHFGPAHRDHQGKSRYAGFRALWGRHPMSGWDWPSPNPNRKVIVLDGDGSLLMNLGAMVTLGRTRRPRTSATWCSITASTPLPAGSRCLAQGGPTGKAWPKAAGYAATFTFENLEDLTTSIGDVMAAEGPVFVHLRVKPEIENTPVQFRQRSSRTIHVAIPRYARSPGQRLGCVDILVYGEATTPYRHSGESRNPGNGRLFSDVLWVWTLLDSGFRRNDGENVNRT